MTDSLIFQYTELRNQRGETLNRPLLPLLLEYKNQKLEVSGLLDSGADVNVLPYSIGLGLGAKWDDSKRHYNCREIWLILRHEGYF